MKTVSVVIPNYKKYPLLTHLPQVIKACLPAGRPVSPAGRPVSSARQACPQAEIIVVDDASPDDTVTVLKKKFPQVKLLVNPTNQRFAVSCNHGVKAAKGDIVILINSDVVPKPGFLTPLIKHFDDPQVFCVGCLEIQTVNGRKVYSGRNQCQFKRGFVTHSKAPITDLKKTTPNCWGSGGSMALDRTKYLSLGGMDPLYRPAYWEDIDLSWRAREKHGYKILFEPKSQVWHNHETTNLSVFGKKKMETMALRNQFLFVWKNIRGRRLIEHFLWLPYHLVLTTIRTKGVFIIAFFEALWQWIKK